MTGSGVIRRLSAANATRPEKRSGPSASREVARIESDCRADRFDARQALAAVGWIERQRNPSSFAETRAIVGSIDVIDEKTQAALSQIGGEEKAAAADEVSPIVRHRASVAQQKVMGFAEPVIGPATPGRTRWLNPSYGLKCRR
jgi:hypothetical protein